MTSLPDIGRPRGPGAPGAWHDEQMDAARNATVKDVALRAGVSASTVSNVLHGRRSVAPDIRDRVVAAVDEVGYVPSVAGRQLRSGQSTVIQLALPDIRSPYYSALAHTVIGEARTLGLTVVIEETDGVLEYERQFATSHPARGIGGVLMCPISITSDDLADIRSRTPTVLLGEHTHGEVFDQVSIDSVAAAEEVTEHLVSTGRRRIGFAGAAPSDAPGPGLFRQQGVTRALARHGLGMASGAVYTTADFGRESGERIGATPSVSELDAIVCATDELAIGVMRSLRHRGVLVPDHIALTGWDDSPDSRYASPPITTVQHDLADIARTSIRFVLDRMAEPDRPARRHVAAHRLIVRDSTAAR